MLSKDLVKVIKDNRPKLDQFLAAFERWMRAIDDIRLTAGNIRNALVQDMARYGYSRTAPVTWLVTP